MRGSLADNPGEDSYGTPVRLARDAAVERLEANDVAEPVASVEWLLAHVLGSTSRGAVSLAISIDKRLDADTTAEFERLVSRRLRSEPTQYIVGKWGFHDIELELRPPILIPRPETEELVEIILDAWKRGVHHGPVRFVDVGCGSGAIGLALLKALPKGSTCVAVDINPDAVELSRANARSVLGQDEACYAAELCSAADLAAVLRRRGGAAIDFIVSNPPYIPTRDMPTLQREVADWEDAGALDGGDDGLDVARDVLDAAFDLGVNALWLELDTSHPEGALQDELDAQIARWTRGAVLRPMRDGSDNPRFAFVRWDNA